MEVDDLSAAYFSSQYTSQRMDVENYLKLTLGSKPADDCTDLICPFGLPEIGLDDVRRIAKEDRDKLIIEALHRARMSVKERAEHDRSNGKAASRQPVPVKPSKGRAATATTLKENAARFSCWRFHEEAKVAVFKC